MTKQRSRRSQAAPPRSQQRWLLLGIIGVVVLVFAAVIVLNNQSPAPATETAGLTGDDPKALGPEDAEVVVKDYSDFT